MFAWISNEGILDHQPSRHLQLPWLMPLLMTKITQPLFHQSTASHSKMKLACPNCFLVIFWIPQATQFVASSPSLSCTATPSAARRPCGSAEEVAFDRSHCPSPLWYFPWLVTSGSVKKSCLWPSVSSLPWKIAGISEIASLFHD